MNYRRVYIQNSKIFITIVANKRRQILIKNIDLLRNSFNLIKVCRLGFNPTKKNEEYKTKLKTVA